MSQLPQDPTQPLEPFLKKVLLSLDNQFLTNSVQYGSVEAYATQFAKQLKPTCAIIINGEPVLPTDTNCKIEFQKKWLRVPTSNHQLNSFDCHLIPGTSSFIVNSSGKVRFDESGRNRLGESADLITSNVPKNVRPVWGSWFGFDINLVVDQLVSQNDEAETIDSFNYRFTYKPDDSVVQI